MARDALATTHPVVQHIETVEQASQAFDAITYEKGEAVIRMLEGYVGADAWRAGVRRYMERHAYGNTVSDDLWRAIEAAAGKPITAIAHDFTLAAGRAADHRRRDGVQRRREPGAPDPGRVQQGPAGQEAAGLAGPRDPEVGGRRGAPCARW